MRDLLIYFACIYEGDYNKIKKAIDNGVVIDKKEIDLVLRQLKCLVVTILDDDYPTSLRELKNPPYVLFYYGDLSLCELDCISMIGMRHCSKYGANVTRDLCLALKDDFVIVSGLAKGIDAISHHYASKTIAVLGCGIDYCYPKENRELYEWIKINGLILSEYPGLVGPRPYYFPWRNRIVAALGLGVVVVEADKKSGTMITVGYALELGRSVFAVPGRIYDHLGTIELIKDGAICIESPVDIIDELNLVKNH